MMDPIEKLFSFPGRGIKTFDAMKRLDARLGFPHRSFRSIHIGGTNGKGSVSLKIAQALRAEGYNVGLYTSPHIDSFRERILVNGEMIPESVAKELAQLILDLVDEELSFFDLLTAMAFMYFKKMQVDWAVIEVGLGGRLDATNIIHPELAIITTIGFDHMHLLGDTLEEIAKEKEGIVKPGVPLIVGPKAASFFPNAKKVETPSSLFYDDENSAIAKAALTQIGISEGAISVGITSRPVCRFEMVGTTILDVAHNVSGVERLIDALKFHFPDEKFHFILAFSKDKDWENCLEVIRPYAAHISFVKASHPKLRSLGHLSIAEVLGKTKERDVVCGSFYIMKEAKEVLFQRA